jgi:hypothetical protein
MVSCCLGLVVFAPFAPAPSAALSPEAVGAVFRESTLGIRIGMILMILGAALLGAFFTVVSAQLRRIEGPRPILTYLQLMMGTLFVAEFIFPLSAIQTAAFRPERADAAQQLLNDYGWLTFYSVASTAVVQMVIIGVAILQDARPDPVFPRWAGYLNIWVGLMIAPGTLVPLFKTGPLAWTGLFCFYLPFAAFFIWLIAMTRLLLKAVDHELAEAEVAIRTTDGAGADTADRLAELTAEVERLSARLARVEGHPAST